MNRYLLLILLIRWGYMSYAQPTFEAFQQPFTTYDVNPDSCIMIEHASGSLIFIEAEGIITDRNPVQLAYREFSSPIDMLVHGVQMHTEFAGTRFFLESTGMFEIYALDGKDTLAFNSDKQMEVRLNSIPQRKNGVEGYRYDEQAANWKSYTNQISNSSLQDDDALWGSGPVTGNEIVEWIDDEDGFGLGAFGASDVARERVFQTMEISTFGLFNYDRIIDGFEYLYLEPTFVTQSGETITSTVYVVYDDINSVFYFPPYTWEDQFFLINGKAFTLFTVGENGAVARIKDDPKPLSQGQSYTFKLQQQRQLPKDKITLAQQTGIR